MKRKQTGIRSAPMLTPKKKPVKSKPPLPTSPDIQEESFWTTPAASARTLHFANDLLTDESMDLSNTSELSSPLTESKAPQLAARSRSSLVARQLSFGEPPSEDNSEHLDA